METCITGLQCRFNPLDSHHVYLRDLEYFFQDNKKMYVLNILIPKLFFVTVSPWYTDVPADRELQMGMGRTTHLSDQFS